MARDWRWPLIAAFIGLSTATRAVGVSLLVPFWAWVYLRGRRRVIPFVLGTGICVSGLLAWMIFLDLWFGDPLAFAKTQLHWNSRSMPNSTWECLCRLATLEPIRATYNQGSPLYWSNCPPRGLAVFNLSFANPLFFLFAVLAMMVGTLRRWLTGEEIAFGFALLFVTYSLRGLGAGMTSMARYASTALPMYIVIGTALARLRPPLTSAIAALSAYLLFVYTALFAGWYGVF